MPSETTTGLRFLLKHGAFLQVPVAGGTATNVIDGFLTGRLPEIVGEASPQSHFGEPPMPWALRVADITGMHTFDYEEFVRQMQAERARQGIQPKYPGSTSHGSNLALDPRLSGGYRRA